MKTILTIDLNEALVLVKELKPMVNTLGYYIGLAGSVLEKGISDNDIDLIIYPHVGKEVSIDTICDRIRTLLGATEMFEIKHKQPSHLVMRLKLKRGYILDLFFLHKKPSGNKPTTQYRITTKTY